MRKHLALLIVTVMVAPFLMAGGMNPGCPYEPGDPRCTVKASSPALTGVLIVDPHENGTTNVTPPAVPAEKDKYAAIFLKKGSYTAAAVFRLPSSFTLSRGCDLSRTEQRFGLNGSLTTLHYNGLKAWMPIETVNEMLRQVGVDPDTAGEPVITDFNYEKCTWDSENPTALQNGGGIFSAEIVVQFVKP